MQGIGDSIYSRPFVRMLVEDGHEVYLNTVLPFMYADLDVKFIKTESTLRTQKKSLASSNAKFVDFVFADREINFFYSANDLSAHGIVSHMEKAFGYEPGSTLPNFDLPPLTYHGVDTPLEKKLAIIRPVTHRSEWLCSSRSPQPNYVAWCSKILMDMGYYTISIADCEPGAEWIVDEDNLLAHQKFHKGELGLEGTLSLIKSADLVVGGSGFIIPASVASDTNLFIIFGGRGKYDNPHKVLDLRMNLKKIGWALPTNFCRCATMDHDCDKTIKDLDSQFFNFMRSI